MRRNILRLTVVACILGALLLPFTGGDAVTVDVLVNARSGVLTVGGTSSFPWLYIVIGLLALLLLLVLFSLRRRQPVPVAVAPQAPIYPPTYAQPTQPSAQYPAPTQPTTPPVY